MEDVRKHTKFWLRDTCGKEHFEEVDLDKSIILRFMLKKCGLIR